MTNNEIWKNIEGYEDYQVSNQGRVRSLKFGKERIMKPEKHRAGYLLVHFCKNGEQKMCLVHRLVALAFIPNPNNFPEVNHKTEDKTDNRVKNLEWCTSKYNSNYGTRNQRVVEKHLKPVLQFTKNGESVKEWKSGCDIQKNLGYDNSAISKCCRGKYKSAYGFVWRYKD